jgi:hypothetical protein
MLNFKQRKTTSQQKGGIFPFFSDAQIGNYHLFDYGDCDIVHFLL